MFKIQLAKYINDNLERHELTYKELAARSGVPSTSIHSYAQGRVNNPDEENLQRIARAFGDPPEIIQQMRRESISATSAENKLMAQTDDKDRMEKFAALLRTSMLAVMEEYRAASAAQQTEIIAHADARIEEERARARDLNAKVLAQCTEEIDRARAHHADLMALKDNMIAKTDADHLRAAKYLQRVVRNLSIALIVVSILSIVGFSVLGGYAVYAYQTFDRADPTRGLYRAEVTPESTPGLQNLLP